jgi:hypothetical protein
MGPNDILSVNNLWTFTYDRNAFISLRTDASVLADLQNYMQNFGNVISATRGFLSDRYAVVIELNNNYYLHDLLDAFTYSWTASGFPAASFVAVDQGAASSQPGGVGQVVTGAVSAVEDVGTSFVLPLALLAAAIAAIYLLPKGSITKEAA